ADALAAPEPVEPAGGAVSAADQGCILMRITAAARASTRATPTRRVRPAPALACGGWTSSVRISPAGALSTASPGAAAGPGNVSVISEDGDGRGASIVAASSGDRSSVTIAANASAIVVADAKRACGS